MAYYDKFGESGYEDFFKIVYQYVFELRLELAHSPISYGRFPHSITLSKK